MESNFTLNAVFAESRPVENRFICVTVEGLLATDGSSLSGPAEFCYTTAYDPYCSNTLLVRLAGGEFLKDVPGITIDLMIHHFSIEAEDLNYRPDYANLCPESYANYKKRWVTIATTLALLTGTSANGELSKRLGDLSIKRKNAAKELLDELRGELSWLTEILKDGGDWGKDMVVGVKAINNADTPIIGRMWANEQDYWRPRIPGANVKARHFRTADGAVQRRRKSTWHGRQSGYWRR